MWNGEEAQGAKQTSSGRYRPHRKCSLTLLNQEFWCPALHDSPTCNTALSGIAGSHWGCRALWLRLSGLRHLKSTDISLQMSRLLRRATLAVFPPVMGCEEELFSACGGLDPARSESRWDSFCLQLSGCRGDVHPTKSCRQRITAPICICQTPRVTVSVCTEGPTRSPATVTAKGKVPAEVSFGRGDNPTSPQPGWGGVSASGGRVARTHHSPHVPAPASCLRSSASAGRAAEVAAQEEVVAGREWAGVPSVCLWGLPGFLLTV